MNTHTRRSTRPSNRNKQPNTASVLRQGIRHHFREELDEFYRNRPIGFTVDHIHPLKGQNASGLHVPWNLQYLTLSDNVSKWNFFPGEWIDGERRQIGNVFQSKLIKLSGITSKRQFSPEHAAKIAEANRRRPMTPERIAAMHAAASAPEARAKQAASLRATLAAKLDHDPSESKRDRQRRANRESAQRKRDREKTTGSASQIARKRGPYKPRTKPSKPLSADTRARMKQAQIDRFKRMPVSDETRARMRAAKLVGAA